MIALPTWGYSCFVHSVLQAVEDALHRGWCANDTEGRLKGILSLSFDALHHVQQSTFLDAATVLRGEPKQLALAVWSKQQGACVQGWYEDLEQRNLVNPEATHVQMHDVLAALAQSMVLDEVLDNGGNNSFRGSRIWWDSETSKVKGYVKVCISGKQQTTQPRWCQLWVPGDG
eukprot:GHUV01037181.1.p1 GENE.GHUV01037181.1~~GHUV01037181.1.p1  ORF type:complete len:173 (-),score=31.49 GHUV01037181.1:1003-1521(-)